MAVSFDEMLERARRRVAEVNPARPNVTPSAPASPLTHQTLGPTGAAVQVPLRQDPSIDVDAGVGRAAAAVQALDRPLRVLKPNIGGAGGPSPPPDEDRPEPDVAGFLASIGRPEAILEVEDPEQGFWSRSASSVMAGFGRIGSGLVRGTDEIVRLFERKFLGREANPNEFRYLQELAKSMADPTTYGYTPTPVWDNFKSELKDGDLWGAAKTIASGGVELSIASIPDMLFLLAAPLKIPYVASLTSQYTTERMERDKRTDPTMSDLALGAATALIVQKLETIGAKRALGIVESSGINTFVKRMWDAIRSEGLTEMGQTAVEDLLVRATSGKGVKPEEFLEDLVESFTLGGAAGGAMRLPSAVLGAVSPRRGEEPPPPPDVSEADEAEARAAVEKLVAEEAAAREEDKKPAAPAAEPLPDFPDPNAPAAPAAGGPGAAPSQEGAGSATGAAEPLADFPDPNAQTTASDDEVAPGGMEGLLREPPEEAPTQAAPAPQQKTEPETRIERRDLDELAKTEEGRAAMRALVERLRSQTKDEAEATSLRLGALRLHSERMREILTGPLNEVFSRLPLDERIDITNALRSGDPVVLQEALGKGGGKAAAPAEMSTPEDMLAYLNSIEAVPAGKKHAAKLPERVDQLLALARAGQGLPGLPESDVAALNKVVEQLTRWSTAPEAKMRKGAVTTHAKVDEVSREIREVLERANLEHKAQAMSEEFFQKAKRAQAKRVATPAPTEKSEPALSAEEAREIREKRRREAEKDPEHKARVRRLVDAYNRGVDSVVDASSPEYQDSYRRAAAETDAARAGGRVIEGEATEVEPSSEANEKLADRLGRAAKRAAMESAGQEILDELEEQGRSPHSVSDTFWKDTYSKLPAEVQLRFQRYLKGLTGWQPGDQVGTDADGKPIVAKDWFDIAEAMGRDLPDRADRLEGTERGYVALMEEANRRVAAQPKEAAPAKKEPAALPRPKPKPHPQTAAQREIIKVKPKPVRGRQAESLLNMLGMQIPPGEGRRALDQLRTVLPGLNTKTGRVFALVPTRDAKGQLQPGAIPLEAAKKLKDVVYAHVRGGNHAVTLQNLKDFLDDIGGGKALDPETQAEVLDFAEQLRSLRQRRLEEEAAEAPETDEERQLREIREETEQTVEGEDLLREAEENERVAAESRRGLITDVGRTPDISEMATGRIFARIFARSLVDITDERILNADDLAMFGAVATEAGFGDIVRQAEGRNDPAVDDARPKATPLKSGDLLKKIADAAMVVARRDPKHRAAARRLAMIAHNLAIFVPDVPVRFLNRPWVEPFGVYIHGFGKTPEVAVEQFGEDLGPGASIGYGMVGAETPQALMFATLHELAHAATVARLLKAPDAPEVKALVDLYEKLRKLVLFDWPPSLISGILDPNQFYGHNAWKDVREFVAEVFTNPQFLRDLAHYDEFFKVTYKSNKTILGKFVDVITKLLGLGPSESTLVRVVTDASWSVALMQRLDPQAQQYFAELAGRTRPVSLSQISELEVTISELGGDAPARLAQHGRLASRDFGSGLYGAARKAFLALHTMDQIERRHADAFEGAAGGGNALKDLVNTYRKRRSISTKYQEDAEKSFSRAWLSLGAQESSRLGAVMRDSTLWAIDPTLPATEQAPSSIKRTNFPRKYAEVKAAYNALSTEAKKVYREARDYFARMRKETRRAAVDLVLESYADAAAKPPTVAARLKLAEIRGAKQLDALLGPGKDLDYGDATPSVRRALLRVMKMTDLAGPYFPLRRYGEFVVSAKEDVDLSFDTEAEAREALERIEDESPANDVTVSEVDGKWKVLGSRYEFSMHDTRAEAERAKEELATRGIEGYVGTKLDANPLGGNEGAIASLMAAVNRKLAGDQSARKLVEMAFIEVMADRAIHASSLMREGHAGVKPEDMRRAVAERAVGSAWNIADMRTVFQESDALKRLRKAAVDTSVDDDMRVRRGAVVNELTRSRAHLLNDRSASVFTRVLSNFGYLRFLADPAYAFVNLTQTPAVAYPTIAARYGYRKTFAAMRRAYRAVSSPTIINAIRGYARKPGDVTQYDLVSATMKALSDHPTYKKYVPALQEMIDNDVIDATFTQELMSAARGGALGHSQWQRMLEYSKLLPQGTEFLNRFVTAITMLELTNGNVEKAADMVRLTQFDYTAENRPRAFRFPGARAILMFKMYAQGIGNLLVSSFYDSIRRHSGRQEAMKTLAGLVGTHSVAAGVLGGVMLEPLRWIINAVLWAMTDDEEQTPDIDTLVSNWAADTFGEKAGEIIARGVPMAVGLDMSRMSLANLVFHNRGQDLLSPEGLVSLLGPLPQVAFDAGRGLQDLKEGRYEQAAAKLVPVKVIADFARALELHNRGISTGTGNVRIPAAEVTNTEVALQALGFTPRRVALDRERRRIERQRQDFLTDTRGSLVRRWRQARSPEARQRVVEEIRIFNKANPSNIIRMQDLLQSQRQAERDRLESLNSLHKDAVLRDQLRFLD